MNRALLTPTNQARRLKRKPDLDDNSQRGTPNDYFRWFDAMFRFTVDVCATPSNTTCDKYFTEADNGLEQSWWQETFFCNPPYGLAIWQWLARARQACIRENAHGMLLLPHRADTAWWNNYVMQDDGKAGALLKSRYNPATRVLWLRWASLVVGVYVHDSRIEFDGMTKGNGAPFPSAFVFMGSPGASLHFPRFVPSGRVDLLEGHL